MAVIKPFRALRPVPEKAEQVPCVPYDVISVDEAREIIEHNPLSFLRVTRPEGDISADGSTAVTYARREGHGAVVEVLKRSQRTP